MTKYFGLTSVLAGETTPIECTDYLPLDNGWVEFYRGDRDWVVVCLPPNGYIYSQMTEEEYNDAMLYLGQLDEDDEQE